jgi:DNA-binding transcriptional LysR family regulator
MEFRHLRCFTVLAEELHFGRAAQRLAMTQPPLSMSIQQLEADVGARLFERNSRGVALTAAGLAFLPRAQALLEQAALAAREARDVGQGLAGQLQIGFAGTVLYRGLPQVLRDFAAAHPRLRLALRELSSSEQLVELVHDRLDLGFVHTTRVPAGFSQILVSSQPFMACLPASHPLAKQRGLPLQALKDESFAIVMRAVSPDYHDRILGLCGRGFRARAGLRAAALAERGVGDRAGAGRGPGAGCAAAGRAAGRGVPAAGAAAGALRHALPLAHRARPVGAGGFSGGGAATAAHDRCTIARPTGTLIAGINPR